MAQMPDWEGEDGGKAEKKLLLTSTILRNLNSIDCPWHYISQKKAAYLFKLLLKTPILLGTEILLNGTAALLR